MDGLRVALGVIAAVSKVPWEHVLGGPPAVSLPPFPANVQAGAVAAVQSPVADEYCPACSSSHDLGVALGYASGMAERCSGEGPLPEGVGGTVPHLAEAVRSAQSHLARFSAYYPQLATDAMDANRLAMELLPRLQWIGSCAEAREVAAKVEGLHRMVYDLALRAKAKNSPQGLAPRAGETAERIRSEARDLAERVKNGEMKREEAVAQLRASVESSGHR